MPVPFRWDLTRREQLGRLVDGEAESTYDGFETDLRECAARVLAQCADSDLVFVGRSPENLFDYMGGLLADTSWAGRLALINVSFYGLHVRPDAEEPVAALRDYFAAVGLTPDRLSRGRRTTFVDLVSSGGTFGRMASTLLDWAGDAGVDPAAVRRQLRFLGITERTKNSPNTWRWYQQAEWASAFPRSALKSVSIPYRAWTYWGNFQRKVSRSNPLSRWDTDELTNPTRGAEQMMALRLAVALYDRGATSAERKTFAAKLAAQPEMRERWFRALVGELR